MGQRGPKVQEYVKIETVRDEEGNVISEKETTKTKRIDRVTEPDYIKLYAETWLDKSKNEIPIGYRALFLELAARMSYCEADDHEHSQLVMTSGIYQEAIMNTLGLKSRDSLQKGLKALCDCNAIRRVQRGIYQINPRYAGKGQWKYNPRISRSSLEDFADYYERAKKEAERKEAERKKAKGKKEERKKLKQGIPQIRTPEKKGSDLGGTGN